MADTIEFPVEVECERCHSTLTATAAVEQQSWNKTVIKITAEPCDDCLTNERIEGQKEGANDPDAYQ